MEGEKRFEIKTCDTSNIKKCKETQILFLFLFFFFLQQILYTVKQVNFVASFFVCLFVCFFFFWLEVFASYC